jgi:phosphopantothenoylcysteine decarboxylase/phosphopantothenate--cysteine ligase
LNEKGAGFETDTNKISIFDSKGQHQEFSLKQKTEVARDIFKYINDYNQ